MMLDRRALSHAAGIFHATNPSNIGSIFREGLHSAERRGVMASLFIHGDDRAKLGQRWHSPDVASAIISLDIDSIVEEARYRLAVRFDNTVSALLGANGRDRVD